MASLAERIKAVLLFRNARVLYKVPGFVRHQTECPVCGGRNVRFEARNRFFPIHRCDACGHCYAAVLPGRRILNLLYHRTDYWEKDKVHQNIRSMQAGPEWDVFLGDRIGILRRTGLLAAGGPPLRFMEIGCSEGIVLHELERLGHTAEGCEMNPHIVEGGREALGVTIQLCTFDEFQPDPEGYDRVIAFHTVEHLCDLHGLMEKIARIMRPGGAVLFEVPCGPEEYANTDHTQFFSDESMTLLLGKYFDEVEIVPNRYTTGAGVAVGSIYGVGRGPKRHGAAPAAAGAEPARH